MLLQAHNIHNSPLFLYVTLVTRHTVHAVYLAEMADSFRKSRWVQPLPQLHPLN